MRAPLASLTVVILGLPTIAHAQSVPNFSGNWVGGAAMVNLMGVAGPREMKITQDGNTLVIDRPYGNGGKRAAFSIKFDGTESKNVGDAGPVRPGNPPVIHELRSQAMWEAGKLRIVTKSDVKLGDRTQLVVTIETFSLEHGDLVVERNDAAVGADFSRGPVDSRSVSIHRDVYKMAK
jgi:hypothetical protein